ncbi:amino acid permease [Aneurinibacillus sp. Ricciae_BoGa-3]|uniref:amino acid permease n=1 Tax=Aneurinibacillus sp. Ricciae_BoGa-3 TaxID=3022697 RepID=UPI002341E4EA|nr:amino acid permease [Aneurinibacillus sp. Ricciae_BoGa-3]WCK55664.1 amino acid permease [Aneurinibacillus sp. Ricciae_BoGa-3]
MSSIKSGEKAEKPLKWWQLSLLGVACTIGTGYFLGTGLAIEMGGPAVLISFMLAAFGTYVVFDVLARMTAEEPIKGSFRSYAKKAYGGWAGFSSGWVYWSSELLIMGSQLTALSLFTRFWFANVPMWIFATGYAILGLLVLLAGTKGFDRLENLFAVLKIAAILMFLAIAALALFGVLEGRTHQPRLPVEAFFPTGVLGLWSSLIYAFYAFGGIEIIGLMAIRLRRPEEAPMAGKVMLGLLTTVYVLSIGLALTLLPWKAFHSNKSPFISALENYHVPYMTQIFNGVLIIAGFSTMVASLFAITTMLVTLAEDQDAPPFFARRMMGNRPIPALGLTAAGMVMSIMLALFMPGSIYEYFTTAAGLLLMYNWLFILVTSGRLLDLTGWGQFKRYLGMALLLLAVIGTLAHRTSRPGFYVSFIFVVLIGVLTFIMQFIRRKGNPKDPSPANEQGFKSFPAKIKSKAD